MQRVWEKSVAEREEPHQGKTREMIIGCYAPREPLVMSSIYKFLQLEKKLPLSLVHKIFDRFASMTVCTTVMTPGEINEFIESIPESFLIAVGPCACRLHTQQQLGPDARDLAAGRLDFCRQTPLNVDIQIAKCGEKFGELPDYRFIDKKQLLELEKECFNMGLVANVYMMMGGEAGICHCSGQTCVPFMANEAIGGKTTVIKKGAYLPRVDKQKCDGSGQCLQVCHFSARKLNGKNGSSVSFVDPGNCYGCGLCAEVCPNDAIEMVPRKS